MSQAKRIGRNVLVTLATQVISWGLSFAVTLFLPRYLNDTGLGAITLSASVAGILSVLVGLGTSTVLVKEIARAPSRLSSLVFGTICLRVPLGFLSLVVGWGIVKALGYSDSLQQLVLLGIGAMVIAQTAETLTSALRGLEDFPRQNAIALVEKFFSSTIAIALVFLRAPLWAFVAVGVISGCFTLVLSVLAVRTHLRALGQRATLSVDRATLRSLLHAGSPFLASAIFVAIYGQSDALLLSKLSTVAAIGWYGLAKRLGGSTMIIPTTVCATMLPMMSRVYQEDATRFNLIVQRMFNLMIISVLPFAALLILAPDPLLTLLHYPASFRNSIPVLIIMGTGVILWFLTQAAGTALIASDQQRVFGIVTGIAALVSVPLCASCIYGTEKLLANGAVGAMLSDVLLEAYMLIAYVLALPKGTITAQVMSVFLRAAAAVMPFVGLFYFVHEGFDLYIPLIGVIAYIPLCKVFGCLDQRDIQLFRGMFVKGATA